MTIDLCKLTIGLITVLILGALAAAIALGQIQEETSHGLMPLVVALANIGIIFAQWAFKRSDDAA